MTKIGDPSEGQRKTKATALKAHQSLLKQSFQFQKHFLRLAKPLKRGDKERKVGRDQ